MNYPDPVPIEIKYERPRMKEKAIPRKTGKGDYMTYDQKLKDPRWTTRRDAIIQRDGGQCVQCETGGELHVHHSHYRAGRDPWEYRDSDLFTLCRRCHEKIHGLPCMAVTTTPETMAPRKLRSSEVYVEMKEMAARTRYRREAMRLRSRQGGTR